MPRRPPHAPHAAPGQVVGLFGGSFDPAHAGHVHLTRQALKRLDLDAVWWLVSPGNPLKPHPPAPLAARIAAARARLADPRVSVTGIESDLGTRATADTLDRLIRLYPRVRFVWLMGADNLAQFHRWDRWRTILGRVPVAVFARPGQRLRALTGPAARAYAPARRTPAQARALGRSGAPAWVFIDMPMRRISSTDLRQGAR